MNTQKIRIAHIELIDDSFFYIRYHENIVVTREDAIILRKTLDEMKCENCPRIYHYNSTISFDFGAIRELSASKNAIAIAVVYDKTLSTDILETIKVSFKALEFNSPISFFESKDKAADWIKDYC